ncbi:MAG: GH3 auxin-responsive promoter family protein, partial [Cyanobacteria bacterium P01_F01_bin.42]
SGGTADDSDYLDPWLRWLLRPFLVMPPYSRTPAAFKENLARTLLQTEALEIISIWSPSFLTAQLDYIQTHRQRLQTDLKNRLSAARSQLLHQDPIPWTELWPQLKLISCWDSVTAADGAAGFRSQFPNVLVQGKGLLSTEAPMTVPLVAAEGCVPLLDEIFFEFEDSQGHCFGLHQLEVGQDYTVIISQMGGLYRYRMGDRVRVTHHFLETPCLQFIGRGQSVSDLVGEKLHLQFVSDLLDRLDLSARFQSLVSVRQPDGYVLLLDRCDRKLETLAQQLEQGLCESYHYQLARQLGQLASVRVMVSTTIAEQLATAKAQSGQRWGDIKHARLESNPIDLKSLQTNSLSSAWRL